MTARSVIGSVLSGVAQQALGNGVGFDLATYLLEKGASLWDYTSTDGQFQENTGSTPADDATEVIGFKVDSGSYGEQTLAQVMAAQTELCTNPDFTSGISGWSGYNSTVSHQSGKLRAANSATFGRAQTPYASVADKAYRFKATVTEVSGSGGSLTAVGRTAADVGGAGVTVFSAGAAPSVSVEGYYAATVTTSYLQLIYSTIDKVFEIDDVSIKEVPGKQATQATANFKPKVASGGGAVYDGSDDRHGVTNPVPSGDFGLFIKASFGASIAATQVLFGCLDVSSNGFYLGVTTGGAVRFKLAATTVDASSGDVRGGTHVIGVTVSGTTLTLWLDGVVVGTGTVSGTRPSLALILGGLNNNGTPGNFYSGTMFKPALIPAAVSNAEAVNLSAALAA